MTRVNVLLAIMVSGLAVAPIVGALAKLSEVLS